MIRPPIRLIVPAMFLIALSAYLSLNVAGEWRGAATTGQRISTIVEAGYCVFGLLAGVTALGWPMRVRALLGCWVFCIAAAAGLAPVTWGGQSWRVGLVAALAGGACAALIAWWVLAASRPRAATGSRAAAS
jgi:hypothetical protein